MTYKLYKQGSRSIKGMTGPLLFVGDMGGVGCGEQVTITDPDAAMSSPGTKMGQVLQVKDDLCVVQVFNDTVGLEAGRTTVWMERDVVKVGVGEVLRGRILNGCGQPADGKSLYGIEEYLPVDGLPINPSVRIPPNGVIETGISALDLMNTLVRGQRLPLFAEPGLPASAIAAQIATHALISGKDSDFFVVWATIGATRREANLFMEIFERGMADRGVLVLNEASEPIARRLLAPRVALTVAEYFAFVKGYDVLVIMADMLHYGEAFQEISAARREITGQGGYSAALYSSLAELYERAGCVAGCPGSVTQVPVITVPNAAHPVAVLSEQITDGQIVLDRELYAKGVFPPVNVPASLSRSMIRGIGRGKTFDSHRVLADQLYAAYAKARKARRLCFAGGLSDGGLSDGGLSDVEKCYLRFGDAFEKSFIGQRRGPFGDCTFETRTLAQSEAKAWEVLSELPLEELSLPRALLEQKIAMGAILKSPLTEMKEDK